MEWPPWWRRHNAANDTKNGLPKHADKARSVRRSTVFHRVPHALNLVGQGHQPRNCTGCGITRDPKKTREWCRVRHAPGLERKRSLETDTATLMKTQARRDNSHKKRRDAVISVPPGNGVQKLCKQGNPGRLTNVQPSRTIRQTVDQQRTASNTPHGGFANVLLTDVSIVHSVLIHAFEHLVHP